MVRYLGTPEARRLKDVSRLIVGLAADLASPTINRLLAAHELASVIVVDGHLEAGGGVAVEVDGGQVPVGATRGEDSPDLVRALLDGRACSPVWGTKPRPFQVQSACDKGENPKLEALLSECDARSQRRHKCKRGENRPKTARTVWARSTRQTTTTPPLLYHY